MKTLLSFFVFLLFSLGAVAQDLVQLEYFFGTDKGFGKNTIISLSAEDREKFLFNLDTKGLAVGNHALYFRYRNTAGQWSHTGRKLIEIVADSDPGLVSYEYFFDKDPGVGLGNQVKISNSSASNELIFMINRQEVKEGSHILYLRSWSNHGSVSHTQWKSTVVRYVNCTAPSVTIVNGVLTSTSGNQYQWYKDNQKITGATSMTYTPVMSGQYAVEVTSANCIVMSEPFSFIITAVEPAYADSLNIFPSPFSNNLTIRNEGREDALIQVYALNGRLLFTFKTGRTETNYDVSQLPTGVYVFKIDYGKKHQVSSKILTKY